MIEASSESGKLLLLITCRLNSPTLDPTVHESGICELLILNLLTSLTDIVILDVRGMVEFVPKFTAIAIFEQYEQQVYLMFCRSVYDCKMRTEHKI